MKTLEESIAAAMDAQQDVAIIPFLPYILQDFWGLGTPAEIVIKLMQKHCMVVGTNNHSSLQPCVLDLGCGKGAVSVKLAAALKCNCYGIDAIPEFIETAKEKAQEYGVDTLCRFEVGDVRKKIEELDRFDVIIFGATGPIFDDYYTALTALSQHLTDKGIVIIEEAYMDDTNTFQHPLIMPRRELLSQFQQAGMKLIDETVGNYSEFADIAKEVENITIRCNELKTKYPEKSSLFENYAQNQVSEYDALENEMIGAVMVLKKKDYQRTYPLLSACGLNCGLCPRYHTNGASKCPGCGGEDFLTKHPSCGVLSCCRRRMIEYCYECGEYPCKKYNGSITRDSFTTCRNMLKDFEKIKTHGLTIYQSELNQKVQILCDLLENYNDGRRKNFFCIAVNLLELEDVKEVMAHVSQELSPNLPIKEKSMIAVRLFQTMADKRDVVLKLHKK